MTSNNINWELYKGRNSSLARKGYETLMEKINENGHELLSDYVRAKDKVQIDFKCGHEPHWITSDSYKSGQGCSKCAIINNANKKKNKSRSDLLMAIDKKGHGLLSEYTTNRGKVLIDFKCGHEPYWITPESYKNGHGCPKCAGISWEQSERNFIDLVLLNNHKMMTSYNGNKDKVLIDFKCGHEPYYITPNSYKKSSKCPKCVKEGVAKVIVQESSEEFTTLTNKNGHELLSEYISAKDKILIDFKCGHEPHWTTPNNYKSGNGCPICSESKGEKIVYNYLQDLGIKAIKQYKIEGFSKRYDLYVKEYNLIIEIHGRQHYIQSNYFKDRTLEQEQENDRRKEELALIKGYNYIVVDYREHNPKLALERFKRQFSFYINNK